MYGVWLWKMTTHLFWILVFQLEIATTFQRWAMCIYSLLKSKAKGSVYFLSRLWTRRVIQHGADTPKMIFGRCNRMMMTSMARGCVNLTHRKMSTLTERYWTKWKYDSR